MTRCSICGNRYVGFGNNARPINSGRCCDDCNALYVLPMRMHRLQHGLPMQEVNPGIDEAYRKEIAKRDLS